MFPVSTAAEFISIPGELIDMYTNETYERNQWNVQRWLLIDLSYVDEQARTNILTARLHFMSVIMQWVTGADCQSYFETCFLGF